MAGDFHDLRADLLAALIPFYEELARQTGRQPGRRDAAWAWPTAGSATCGGEMGETDQAEQDFRRAVGVFSRLAERYPADPEVRLH